MIQVLNGGNTTAVACDRCRAVCEESRTPGADQVAAIDWYGGMAMAAAKLAGWAEAFVGQNRKDLCPACAKARAILTEAGEQAARMSREEAAAGLAEVLGSGELSLRAMQRGQPWTVPHSARLTVAAAEVPHLLASHAVLHAAKSVGKLAAVFEAADHGKDINGTEAAAMSADLVTAALRIANLLGFDLQHVLETRVREKNGVGFGPG